MDDLETDLFDSVIKPKNRLSQPQKGTKKQSVTDFDEDDPLAGLDLSDADEDKKPAPRPKGGSSSTEKGKVDNVSVKVDIFPSTTSLLPDSPPPQSGRRSFLDNLLAKSDVAVASEKPRQSEFVLNSKYQAPKTPEEGTFSKPNDDFQFGGYVPSATSSQLADQRRPATAAPSSSLSVGDGRNMSYTPSTETAPKASLPRTSRRGIQPTTGEASASTLDQQMSIAPTRFSTSLHLERRQSTDWLELKDDSTPAPSSATDRVKNDPNSFKTEITTAAARSEPKKSDNFMDWLGAPKTAKESSNEAVTEQVQVAPIVAATVMTGKSNAQFTNKGINITAVDSPPVTNNIVAQIEYDGKLAQLKTQMAEIHSKFSEESLSASATTLDLQTKVRRLEFERDQFKRSLEGLENRYKEEVDALELSFKKRTQLMEDSYQRREKRLQDELETLLQDQLERQKQWDRERSNVIATWQKRLDESTRERVEDLERVRELQKSSVGQMKRDHEMAIERLQQIKKLEVDAMNEAHSHSRTLQLVIEQLKSNTNELGILQNKVSDNHGSGMEEREVMYEIKERQLKLVQDQLDKQRSENCQERATLRQLISSLEERLQKQSLGLEEEQLKITQEKNQLELERKSFLAMKKSESEHLEKSKQLLENAKKSFMEEQSNIMQQIYNEKRSSYLPRMDNESFHSRYTVIDPSQDSFSLMKAQAELDANFRYVDEERKKLEIAKNKLKLEREQVSNDRIVLERQQIELEEERASINSLALKVKQRSEEVEVMCISAVKTREEGFTTLQESKKLQHEFTRRQETLSATLETLKTKERRLAEEKAAIARKHRDLDHLSSKLLCVQCQVPLYEAKLAHRDDPAQERSTFVSGDFASSWVSREAFDPTLVAWQLAAERDKKYLEQESFYLQNLQTTHYGS